MANLNDKIAVIAGGSNGLGLAIGRAFSKRGAKVVLLARNSEKLRSAVDGLNESHPSMASGIPVDATKEDELAGVVSNIETDQGRVDFWVNAIGQSTRTCFAEAKVADYRKLMEQNFFACLNCSLAALPLLEKTSGSLINMGSLASKTAWPFIAPYVTSKHALAGFCHQLRLEGPTNVHYLHVCPGPIQRNDDQPRYSEESGGLSDAAKKPGAGAPVKRIDPDWLAEKIIWACEKKKPELIVPLMSRFMFTLLQISPWLGDKLIRRFCR